MSNPWVLLTGPKGPTGAQLPVPPDAVRRYCGYWNSNYYASAGFVYAYGYSNYYGTITTTQPHSQLMAWRNAQGRCTYNGLTVVGNPDTTASIFTLPWDMLPSPMGVRRCSIADANNARARFDFLYDQTYGWHCLLNDSQNALTNGVFIGFSFSWQSFVPSCWVDYGMKVDVAQAPVLAGMDPAYDYTVSPGQISGFIGGEPFTQVFPVATTVRLNYVAYTNRSSTVLFYYDVPNQQFNHWLSPDYSAQAVPINAAFDPTVWLPMAEAGQVVLTSHQPGYSTNMNYDGTTLMDHRFLMRGPLDTITVPSS